MKKLLSAALLTGLAFGATYTSQIDSLLKEIDNTEKNLQEKINLNYVTKEDIKTLNSKLETIKAKLNAITNQDLTKANPKDVEQMVNKVATLSNKIVKLSDEIVNLAKEVRGDEPKTQLFQKTISSLSNINNNLETIATKVDINNLPSNIQGNIVLDQSIITENSTQIQETIHEVMQSINTQKSTKMMYNTKNTKEDEIVVAGVKAMKNEAQEKQDKEDRQKQQQQQRQQQQNPMMMMMGGMMNGGMMNGMMGGMGGMMQNAPMMNAVGGMMGGGQ